ncbi:sugar transferase [Microbacterium sp.]|uniref:sugar transferase n=1 Tax=Microbacterium sp. TaxID=51671 RepID=UPI003A88D6D9
MSVIEIRSLVDANTTERTSTHSGSPSVRPLAACPRTEPALERRRQWEQGFSARLFVTDVLLVVALTAATAVIMMSVAGAGPDVWSAAVLTGLLWIGTLGVTRSRAGSVIGSGPSEYKRVVHASTATFGILAAAFLIAPWDALRAQLLIALPAGTVIVLIARWCWRRWLVAQRRGGSFTRRTIVTGTRDDIEHVLRTVGDSTSHGHSIVGVAPSDGGTDNLIVGNRSYPVVSSMATVAEHARRLGADTVIVANRPDDDPEFIKRLSWDLEGTASELVLSSGIADVAGPRISLQQVDGLPLIRVKIPEFEGTRHALKRAVDIAVSTVALIPIALITPVIALLIALDDRGPVFFRQTRVGRDGRTFAIVKFRTMSVDAEAQLDNLRALNEGSGPLFKLTRDPRVTRVGAFLRKYSLDELPQFWNVLRGDMSVVGPRPPLPGEVSRYEGRVYRRLFIKPGITGLWQVSGRSDLTWEESVRLDLRYVENWSVMNDLMIMSRTARAMIAPKGAY